MTPVRGAGPLTWGAAGAIDGRGWGSWSTNRPTDEPIESDGRSALMRNEINHDLDLGGATRDLNTDHLGACVVAAV